MSGNIDVPSCPQHPFSGQHVDGFGRVTCPKCGYFLYWTNPPDPLVLRKPTCHYCDNRASVKLVKQVFVNGTTHVSWFCIDCEQIAVIGQPFLPQLQVVRTLEYYAARFPERVYPRSIDDLPCIHDASSQRHCDICGSPGAEYHHFMPQVFASDPLVAPDWKVWREIGIYLCRRHHSVWHDLVAPLSALSKVRNGGDQ